jgi:hypothetical protein
LFLLALLVAVAELGWWVCCGLKDLAEKLSALSQKYPLLRGRRTLPQNFLRLPGFHEVLK